jgi:hypothetical protein
MNVVEEGRHLTGMIDERDVGIGCARGETGNWRPNKTTLSALELHRHAVVHGSGLLWIDSGRRAGRRSQLAELCTRVNRNQAPEIIRCLSP